MARTLEQLNNEFFDTHVAKRSGTAPSACIKTADAAPNVDQANIPPKKSHAECRAEKPRKKRTVKRVLDILFYAAIAFTLIAALVFSSKPSNGLTLGYSWFHVLSGSMQPEIPQDSLVITKKAELDSIQIGDDITFIRDDNAVVTHRVVDIVENYDGSGNRGFKTWGINNLEPDPDIVCAGNVIGAVKLCIPKLGSVLTYISENIGIVFLLLGGLAAMVIVARLLLRRLARQSATYFNGGANYE